MGSSAAMTRRLKKPNPNYKSGQSALAFTGTMERDPVKELTDARRIYVARTGKTDLTPVEKTAAFKKFSKKQKKRYYELNPQEAPAEDANFTLSKKTLIGVS